MTGTMTLAELAETSGLPARTIRFYIARGLLDGPVKAGRGAVYTAEHVDRLERIKQLQSEGQMLSGIARILGGIQTERTAATPAPWWQHALAEDVVVWTRADMSPWRTKQVRAAIDALARVLEQPDDGKRSKK